mgnify:CR=1 FL=1|jgi:hypothetical protein
MASSDLESSNVKDFKCCENDPNFAVICSFIDKFGASLGLQLDIENLKNMIEASEHSKLI